LTENEDNIATEPNTVAPSVVHIPPPPPAIVTTNNNSGRIIVIVMAILFFLGALVEAFGIFRSLLKSPISSYINGIDENIFVVANMGVAVGLFKSRLNMQLVAICLLVTRAATVLYLTYMSVIFYMGNTQLPDFDKQVRITGMIEIVAVYLLVCAIMIYFLTRPAVKEVCIN